MWLRVGAGRLEETAERADLIDQQIAQLLALHLHLPAPKTLAVGQRRVRADLDPVLKGEADGRVHHRRVRRMEAAGDIGDADERHDPLVVAEGVEAVALADVAVDGDRHDRLPIRCGEEHCTGTAGQSKRAVFDSPRVRRPAW